MEERYLQLLAEIVNIDSGTGDAKGLSRLAGILEAELVKLQFQMQTLNADDGSKHYYATRGQGERILLIAHLDTVFPRGTVAKRPFKIEGDLAFGPGVSDCKSGVVTIVGAMERLSLGAWPAYEIGCLFNTDEEIGSPGSRGIIQRLAKESKAVLVIEPAEEENITVARKGIGRFTLQVFGKAAHSGSNYQDGRNAILEMAHKIIAIQALTGCLPGITLNVGVTGGGVRPNIVPDYAEAEIDLRFQNPGDEEKVIQELKKIACQTQIAGCTGKLKGGVTRPPMPLNDDNLQLYKLLKGAGAEIGISLGTFQSGGGSDANFTAALGIPTVDGVGPIGGGHHSDAEYLSLPSLWQRIQLLAGFFKYI